MNSSQKRKLTWIIIGIVVLILFSLINHRTKDIALSPIRSMLPPTYPTSPIDQIPGSEYDSFLEAMRARSPTGPPVIVPAQPQWQDICDSSTNGWTNCMREGPRFYGQTCSCSGDSCSWSDRKLCDSNGCTAGNPGSCHGEFES